jgi:hypothetical protein
MVGQYLPLSVNKRRGEKGNRKEKKKKRIPSCRDGLVDGD